MGEGLTASPRNTSRVSKPEEEAGTELLRRTQLLRLFNNYRIFSNLLRTPFTVSEGKRIRCGLESRAD